MKLYFSPGACSLSIHIILREAGLAFDLEKVDLRTKMTEKGTDYKTINPKGYVPALQLDDGEILTEVPAVIQYLADQVPDRQLAPVAGSMQRYRLMEWLNFISSELHKGFGPLFKPNAPEEAKQFARDGVLSRIAFVAPQLKNLQYLTGDQFTVADAYLFVVLRWCQSMKIDLSPWPEVQSYLERIGTRPAVHEALAAEGLIKA